MLKDLKKYTESNQATYASKGYRGLKLAGKLKFTQILYKNNQVLKQFESKVNKTGECFIGPFIGEFGNFLLHMLPYLSYLHKNGVKIHYCGMTNQTPFLVDDNGDSLLTEFVELRDFFHEVRPAGNQIEFLPDDVDQLVKDFQRRANESSFPYLDIFSDVDLYWYSYRNWELKGRQHVYDLSKVYGTEGRTNKAVIFPRKMNKDFTPNNGSGWDYKQIANEISPYFDEVVFIGHPSMSDSLDDVVTDKIKLALSTDNTNVLKHCSTAKLVITQHSGAMHVSGYTQTPVLLIFKGDPPIKGLDDSIRFRENFPFQDTDIVFSHEEIIKKVKG